MKLLKKFGSVKRIKEAQVSEIQEIVKNQELAKEIKEFLEQNM
jgi:ERCC4-type nuclease